MLQKKPLGGKRFQVTFTAPSIPGVETLHLCGEFNGWSETANPMRREPDGSWSATLSLEGGNRTCSATGTTRGRGTMTGQPTPTSPTNSEAKTRCSTSPLRRWPWWLPPRSAGRKTAPWRGRSPWPEARRKGAEGDHGEEAAPLEKPPSSRR